jgi:hypothetical protein
MILQSVICAALFFISVTCIGRANLLFGEIVAEINRVLPEDRAISRTGFFARYRDVEVFAEYKRLYPDGKLVRKMHMWTAIGFACFFGFAGYLFFSGVGSAGYIPRGR